MLSFTPVYLEMTGLLPAAVTYSDGFLFFTSIIHEREHHNCAKAAKLRHAKTVKPCHVRRFHCSLITNRELPFAVAPYYLVDQ